MNGEAGKGDTPRPLSVPREVYEANWARAFSDDGKSPKAGNLPGAEDRSGREVSRPGADSLPEIRALETLIEAITSGKEKVEVVVIGHK